MKLRLISLIRDEIDIINLFLKHVDALFDEVFLLDHQSMDGTTEVLRQAVSQRPGWKYYHVDIKQKCQLQLMNSFIRKFKEDRDQFDYLFFLDCDEFFCVENRKALEELLARNADDVGVYGFQWINSFPKALNSSRPLNKRARLFVSNEAGGWQKIAVDWHKVGSVDFCVKEGNHSAFHLDGQIYPTNVIGKLLHIPIRSRRQLSSKALMSYCSILVEANRDPGNSFQFRRYVERIANGQLEDVDLIRFLCYYQEGLDPIPAGWEKGFLQQCYLKRLDRLGIAFSNRLRLKQPRQHPSMEQRIANALTKTNIVDPNDYSLVIEGETVRFGNKI